MTFDDPYPTRDLRGYGRDVPPVSWPGNAVVAVSVVINFEEGAELAVSDGDATTETVSEIASVVSSGTWDQGTEQQFAYGSRVGVWRVLDTLARYRFPTTFYMCGRAVERLPEVAREIVRAGHEPACHGWRWRPHSDYENPEQEKRDLMRCIEVTETATGERPLGFFGRGSESRWTRGLLRELGFKYTSNGFDDDLPYLDRDSGLLVVPYSLDTNDTKFFRPNGFVLAEELVRYVRDSLEVLIEEGRRGAPKMLNIGFHLRISGRPGRIRGLQHILDMLESFGGSVWVARRLDIAEHWLNVPHQPAASGAS
jgi:peptidoglycan/xylan/chitin deacetylase (PgdA/CDA1 family)